MYVVPIEIVLDLDLFLQKQIRENNFLVALKKTNQSILYTNFKPVLPLVLFLGSESRGVSQQILDVVHTTIHIPMYLLGLSLNVSMSCVIAVYKIIEKLKLYKDSR